MSVHIYKSMVEAVEGLRQRGFTPGLRLPKRAGSLLRVTGLSKAMTLPLSNIIASKECLTRTIPRWCTRSKRRVDSREFSWMPMAHTPIGRPAHC